MDGTPFPCISTDFSPCSICALDGDLDAFSLSLSVLDWAHLPPVLLQTSCSPFDRRRAAATATADDVSLQRASTPAWERCALHVHIVVEHSHDVPITASGNERYFSCKRWCPSTPYQPYQSPFPLPFSALLCIHIGLLSSLSIHLFIFFGRLLLIFDSIVTSTEVMPQSAFPLG